MLAEFSTRVLHKKAITYLEDKSATRRLLEQREAFTMRMAYRYALSRQAYERKDLERRWHNFGQILKSKGEMLQEEEYTAEATSSKGDRKIPRRTLDRLRTHVEASWASNLQWIDVLILGEEQHGVKDALLESPFERVWDHASQNSLYAIRTEETESVLRNLESRVQAQGSRLDKWKKIQAKVSERADTRSAKYPSHLRPLHHPFSSKQLLHEQSESRQGAHTSRELNSAGRAEDSRTAKRNRGSTSVRTDKSEALGNEIPLPHRQNGQRVYHLRSRRNEGSSCLEGKQSIPAVDSALLLNSSDPSTQDQQMNRHTAPQDQAKWEQAAETAVEALDTKNVEFKPLPSLAERTRMTMALTTPLKEELTAHAKSRTSPSLAERPASAGSPHATFHHTGAPPLNSLADRTRQSMNLMAMRTPAPAAARPRQRRTSSLYDVLKTRPVKKSQETNDADTTLFEQTIQNLQADYESVFKPRPRVAVSPVLSPVPLRNGIGENLNLNGHASSGEEDDFS